MAAPKIKHAVADALLNAFKAQVADHASQAAHIRIYADSAGNPGTELANFSLDSTTPFGAISTSGNYRQCGLTTGGNEDLSNAGLSGAGAGTNAAHYRVESENGLIIEQGTVRGSADADNGEQVVLDNKNIADGQTVTLTSFTKRVLALLGA